MKTASSEKLQITKHFESPTHLVFDAWVNPDHLKKWMFVGPTSEIIETRLDLKVGGKFSIVELEHSTNEKIDHFGEYLEIIHGKLLSFTLTVPKHFDGTTQVTVEFEDKGGGCTLIFTQTGVAPKVTEESWKQMFQSLQLSLDIQ